MTSKQELTDWTVGFIGLGAMGGRMARNLVDAGYRVIGYDIRPAAVAALVNAGGEAGEHIPDVVGRSDVVLTSLVGPVYVEVAETELLPYARIGQVFIDHSTGPAPETRRLAEAFEARGASYLDIPVSGWITGAEQGTLKMFAGGGRETFERVLPMLEVLGDPDRITYGGEAGMGQVMKVVQQLQHRLLDVARLELMAFGVQDGLDLETVMRVLDVDPEGADRYAALYRTIKDGAHEKLGFLFSEWGYYLEEAEVQGIPMPMLEAAYRFYREGDAMSIDEQGREMPSIWKELLEREGPALD